MCSLESFLIGGFHVSSWPSWRCGCGSTDLGAGPVVARAVPGAGFSCFSVSLLFGNELQALPSEDVISTFPALARTFLPEGGCRSGKAIFVFWPRARVGIRCSTCALHAQRRVGQARRLLQEGHLPAALLMHRSK